MPDRIYSEDEISALLKRAAQIQHAQPASDTHGLSRAELERLADDVGISQQALVQALHEMHGGQAEGQSRGFHVWGGPQRHTVTRTLAAPLTDATWAQIVEQLRLHTNGPGVTTTLGANREWHIQKNGRTDLVARDVKGQTRLTLTQTNDHIFGIAHGTLDSIGFVYFVLLTFAATDLPLLPRVLGGLLILATCLLTAWLISRTMTRSRARKVDALMDRLDLALAASGAAEQTALSESTPALQMDSLPEPEPAANQTSPRTRA